MFPKCARSSSSSNTSAIEQSVAQTVQPAEPRAPAAVASGWGFTPRTSNVWEVPPTLANGGSFGTARVPARDTSRSAGLPRGAQSTRHEGAQTDNATVSGTAAAAAAAATVPDPLSLALGL